MAWTVSLAVLQFKLDSSFIYNIWDKILEYWTSATNNSLRYLSSKIVYNQFPLWLYLWTKSALVQVLQLNSITNLTFPKGTQKRSYTCIQSHRLLGAALTTSIFFHIRAMSDNRHIKNTYKYKRLSNISAFLRSTGVGRLICLHCFQCFVRAAAFYHGARGNFNPNPR